LAGNDGTGTTPIPYAQFLDLYRPSYTDALPSESFVHMQQNASWAFGFTYAEAYTYSGVAVVGEASAMFDSTGDSQPNAVFNYVKETNRQSRNLGPALVRLVSTGIFMKPGTNTGWGTAGTGLAEWSSRAGTTKNQTDYITSITPYTNSKANGGVADSSYNDVLIGYFEPLLANNSKATFVDGLEFMIVNAAASGTAAESAQWYHLTFDFTGSNCDELVRLSHYTGKVEAIPLTHISGKQYYVDMYLGGGCGDLFTFWDSSNALPTIPEPGTLVLIGICAISLAVSVTSLL
jgi:hypothetical protein